MNLAACDLYVTYRSEKWSGRLDSNQRPPAPKAVSDQSPNSLRLLALPFPRRECDDFCASGSARPAQALPPPARQSRARPHGARLAGGQRVMRDAPSRWHKSRHIPGVETATQGY